MSKNKGRRTIIIENRTRNKRITFRLNESEYEEFERKVKKSKLNKEAFIRKAIKKSNFVEPPSIEYYKLINELNPIGNNLNQIAKKLNSNIEVDKNSIRDSMEKLDVVLTDLDKQIRGV